MIKNYKQFVNKINENMDAEVDLMGTPEAATDISTEDMVRAMSDQLGIDIDNYDVGDIVSNMDVDNLSYNEARRVVFQFLSKMNG